MTYQTPILSSLALSSSALLLGLVLPKQPAVAAIVPTALMSPAIHQLEPLDSHPGRSPLETLENETIQSQLPL
ncbi:MAG: hypothetical protein WBC73_12040 [Phormidesmis sp.]